VPPMPTSGRNEHMATRILIADDHEMVRRGLRSLIESKRSGVQVLEARDGREAVEKTVDSNPDLVILDVSMPLLDGFGAAREIRKVAADTPILILTFQKTEMLKQVAHSIGVSGYITKGEDSDVLLRAIDAAMGNQTDETPESDEPQRRSRVAHVPQVRKERALEDSSRSHAESVRSPVLRVLLLHGSAACRKRCVEELKDVPFEIEADVPATFEHDAELRELKEYDIILAEYPIPKSEGTPAVDPLSRMHTHTPLILLTHNLERKTTAELITKGAADCVEIDNLGQLPMAIRRALKENSLHGERHRVEQQLQHSEARYRALTGNLAFGICRCGMEGQFLNVNPALVRMLGYESREELLRLNLAANILNDPSQRAQLLGERGKGGAVDPLETVWSRKDGTRLKVRLSGREVSTAEGLRDGYEIIVQDVTKQRELEDDLREQATRDPLTGLANYRHLLGVLDSEMRRFNRTGREFAVLLFDLDGLKNINDRYGHLAGSEALCRLADVLAAGCRNIDTAARFGGDEFAVVFPETGLEAAKSVAQRLCHNLSTDDREPNLSVSVGVAIYPSDGESIEALLLAADRALYGEKSRVHDRARIMH
jgi:diguanylate cyclase (GGDEF)-like protein/PAS domain S-box-containing protein